MFHLGKSNSRAGYNHGVNTVQRLNRGEEILVSYCMEAQLCMLSRRVCEHRRYHEHACPRVGAPD